ncbi:MAG: phosphatase PAP2 family protein [Patescibacteria group bacterium]
MTKYREKIGQAVGIAGALASTWLFVRNPSFPTPDKLVVFMIFTFMIFKQALVMLRLFGPFILILLAYESFRSVADQLNGHVNYTLAPGIDDALFGNLPTVYLQNWLWDGHVRWYDLAFYLPYMLHFVLPIGLGVLIWKKRENYYWRFVTTYCLSAFMAFFTFLLFPAAPPWLAVQNNTIEPITRITSEVWGTLGVRDFPSFYNEITPNIVAAIPSLHAAWATLLSVFIFKYFGRRWGTLSLLYPFAIFIGTVYQGEHYAFDIIAGAVYAYVAYLLTPPLMRVGHRLAHSLLRRLMLTLHKVQ